MSQLLGNYTKVERIEYFFKYKDKKDQGIYFKVAFDRAQGKKGRYYLYSVTDK